jgi:hypothetical protein
VLRHCPPHRSRCGLGDPLGVLADLAELVEQWHQIGSWNPTWVTIRLCVDVFVRLGEHQVAGQLLGAMEASTTAGPIYGADADRLASAEASLRFRLGDATYDALTARGAALADADAIALTRRALSDLMQSTT